MFNVTPHPTPHCSVMDAQKTKKPPSVEDRYEDELIRLGMASTAETYKHVAHVAPKPKKGSLFA